LGGIRKKTLTLHTSAQIKEKIYFIGLILLFVLTLLISAFSFIFSIRLNKKFKNISKELFERSNEITTVVTSLKKVPILLAMQLQNNPIQFMTLQLL
jgi:biopolymer transport protein ExbB/TolQ